MKKYYNVKKEDTSILASDVTFIPYDNNHIPFIVELKVNKTLDSAIEQIKDKEYVNSLGELRLVIITRNII